MKPTTISLLQKCKQEKRRFATITAYDYSFAKLFAEEGINVMLVGDSLGMTVQGHDSTLPVTVEDIAYHTRAVRRGAPACLLLSDLPFMAYATPEQAFDNAAAVMRAGANMVKIEGGAWLVETVRMLTERAVPVCGHLGLTPQSVNIFGGYKVQGRGDAAQALFDDALALEAAGAQLLVLGLFATVPFAELSVPRHAASLSDESALGPASIEIHRPVALRLPGLHVLRQVGRVSAASPGNRPHITYPSY